MTEDIVEFVSNNPEQTRQLVTGGAALASLYVGKRVRDGYNNVREMVLDEGPHRFEESADNYINDVSNVLEERESLSEKLKTLCVPAERVGAKTAKNLNKQMYNELVHKGDIPDLDNVEEGMEYIQKNYSKEISAVNHGRFHGYEL